VVGFGKFAQVAQKRAQRHQVFEPTGFPSDLTPLIQHSVEVHAARLINIQAKTVDVWRRCPTKVCLCKTLSCVGKAMGH
jgi:hypothetical protein